MKILGISVSIIALVSIGCKNSSDIIIGEKEITKIDLKEKESTLYFTESDSDTAYNMIIISTSKEDEFQDMSFKANFEMGTKEKQPESSLSYNGNDRTNYPRSESIADESRESFAFRETDDLDPKRKFNIPEDSSDELRPAEKIGEKQRFSLYKY